MATMEELAQQKYAGTILPTYEKLIDPSRTPSGAQLAPGFTAEQKQAQGVLQGGLEAYLPWMTQAGQAATTAGADSGREITNGWSADLLSNFYSGLRPINGVPIFEDGNIQKTGSVDSGYGVIADKTALAALTSVETRTERQRDASLRATEIVMTADYGVFELDDTKGAPVLFEIGDLATA